jgi:hypothetical protein
VAGSVGDIYTKVAMPRSRSFMNVVGASTGQKRHYNLQELFKELKEKEGIQVFRGISDGFVTCHLSCQPLH